MDEHADSALHYGHVGRAVYLPETKTWTFGRSFTQPPSITYTGETIETVPSPCHAAQSQSPSKISRQADDKLIPNARPDFAADWPSIRDDAFSKVVTSASNTYDPLVSSSLDLGYALDYTNDEATAIPGPLAIAAVVTGESRNAISFRMLVNNTTELRHEDSVIYVPSIGDADTTEWSRWGHSILQICFARPVEGKSTWMAARLPDVTTIFRPIYRRNPVPTHVHDDDVAAVRGPLRNSRLDANPVVEVNKSGTGGFTHADVTFNPWYPRQFAIVDTRGNWTVWEVTGRQRRRNATWAANIVTSGSLPLLNEMINNRLPRHDGWASVEWIVDFSTLLVSDRRSAMIFQMVGKDVRTSTVELGMMKQSEWVLDVQRSARDTSQFFVLTTSRLLWFDTTTAQLDQGTIGLPLRSRFAWRHFRDPEDLTLRLSDVWVNGDLHLVLYSRLAELVQVFPLPVVTDEQAVLVSVPDPFILDVPLVGNSLFTEHVSSPYSTFVFREIDHTPAPGRKMRYNPDMTLIKLFWADPSLAVYETLFKGPDNHRALDEEDLPLEDRDILQVKRHFVHRKERGIDEEQFVVDDWDESVTISGINRHQPMGALSSPNLPWNADPQWALNWTSVYAHVVTNLATVANQDNEEGPRFTLKELIKNVENDLSGTLAGFQTSETMLELGGRRPMLDDIDDGADDLSRLVSTVLSQSPSDTQASCRHMILPLQFSNLFHGMPTLPVEASLDFLETYNELVDEWVTSVPHGTRGIPNQTRVLKEKTARAVALDLLLSRLIRVPGASFDKRASQGAGTVDSGRTETERVALSQNTPIQLASSQDTSRPIQATRVRSSEFPAGEASAPTYSKLSTYTTFKEPRQMPRNVANLLSHWQMGTDPSTYVWSKTSQLLEEEEAQRTPGPSTPRHRIPKKRSQLTPAPDASSLPPTPVAPMVRPWGSQPDNPVPKFPLPSSQPTVDEAPMTQIERGQFGAREAKKSSKSKKKRRAAGF